MQQLTSKRYVAVALILAVVVGVLALAPNGSLLASPPHQIDCGDETVSVSTSLTTTWPNTDFCQHKYPYSEFLSGGVRRDGIPPVYPQGYIYPDTIYSYGGSTPLFYVSYQSIEEGNAWLADQSPVLSVEINGDARAFALGALTRHEIANTTIGGVPVAVTFCPLCNTGIVFERVVDGQEHHFGVSGFLRNSDLVMWDHETESWWQQATGEGVVGDMTGAQLTFVTSSMVSWGDFKAAFPDGQIFVPLLSGSNEPRTSYDNNPYVGYDSSEQPFLFRSEVDNRLHATERVLGYENGETFIAYPFSALEEVVVVNDEIDSELLVVFWQPGATSALDRSSISGSREVGSATLFSPVLEDGTVLTFYAEGTVIKDQLTDSTWNIFGEAIDGELAGTQLVQNRSIIHFWFAWSAFHPETEIWEISAE